MSADISLRPIRVINDNKILPDAHAVALYFEVSDDYVIKQLKKINRRTRMVVIKGCHVEFADNIQWARRKKVRVRETGKVYPSVRDMAIMLGRREEPIRKVLQGESESYYGDHLEYV